MDKEREAAERALIRSYRVDTFFWGWSWCACVDTGMKLAGLIPTGLPQWGLLVLFVFFAAYGSYLGRKTRLAVTK